MGTGGSVIIRGARVLDPANNIDEIKDLYVKDGKISAPFPDSEARRIIGASGLWAAPGFIDMHAHLREPGFEHKEDIAHGARAALAGGFTTICCMPNTKPVADSPEVIRYIRRKAEEAGFADVLPIGSITVGQAGRELSPFEELAAAGACAFSEDGKTVADSMLMKKAYLRAKALGKPVLSHCEDACLGLLPESEEIMTARDLILAGHTGAAAHICHVSTKTAAGLLAHAQKCGVRATGEACPHHFALCEEMIPANAAKPGNYIMSPPLRTRGDMEAVREALANGVIGVIATDHAPHTDAEKAGEHPPNGIVGLETALGLCLTNLVETGYLSPLELIRKLTANPAKILGIDRGTLTTGARADIVLIDPGAEYMVEPEKFFSKGRNTPFEGWVLRGRAVMTVVNGRIAHSYQRGGIAD